MPGDDGLEGAPSLPCAQFVPLPLIFPDIGVAALVGQIKFGAPVPPEEEPPPEPEPPIPPPPAPMLGCEPPPGFP